MTSDDNVPRETSINDVSDLEERDYERLRRMLDRAKVGNGEVAKATGVSGETVSRWRSGAYPFDDETLGIIVELLRKHGVVVSRGWIRFGEVPTGPIRRVAEPSPFDGAPPVKSVRVRQTPPDDEGEAGARQKRGKR